MSLAVVGKLCASYVNQSSKSISLNLKRLYISSHTSLLLIAMYVARHT